MKFWTVLIPCALAMSAPLCAETLTNADVLTLLDAGLGDEAVIAKIETDQGSYATDTATLLELRPRGVSSAVIAAMVKKTSVAPAMSDSAADPLAPHFPGVYLYDDWSAEPRMWKIDPTSSTQTKTGGIFGYALTGGIASASVKASGFAQQAARSLRLTASALWPSRAGSTVERKCRPSTSMSEETASCMPGAGASSAQSSPTPSGERVAGRWK